MKLHSYVVSRDYGFAPNPFFGFCTLATCKPDIRRFANIGDWIIGTGSAGKARTSIDLRGHLVFAMNVEEILSFDDYWLDPRFSKKKPSFNSSKKHAYGDNIYHCVQGEWIQERSHHSLEDGSLNKANLNTDTKSHNVLLSRNFKYWGEDAVGIPRRFRNYQGWDICVAGRGRKVNHPEKLVTDFIKWLESSGEPGINGFPRDW